MKRQVFLAPMTAIGLFLAPAVSLAQTQTEGDGQGTSGPTTVAADAAGETAGAQTSNGGTAASGTQATVDSVEGTFDSLSPGGRKITRALFDAQKQPAQESAGTADGSGAGDATAAGEAGGTGTTTDTAAATPRTLDEIAAAKASGKGWGQVFKEMKAEGLIDEKNLGQAISKANRSARPGDDGGSASGGGTAEVSESGPEGDTTAAAVSTSGVSAGSGHAAGARRPVTITLGNGQTVVVGSHGGHGKHVSGGNAGAKSRGGRDAAGGIVSGSGASASAGPGSGDAHGGNASFSHGSGHGYGGRASAGIVSAGGATVGAGAQTAVTHGNGRGGANGSGRGHGRSK